MERELQLKDGYFIFYAASNEEKGEEMVARMLVEKIRAAQRLWDIEFISNAKIDNDSGSGRAVYFGYQCTVLKKKDVAERKEVSKK